MKSLNAYLILRRFILFFALLVFPSLFAQESNFTRFLVEGNNRFAFSSYEKLKTDYKSNFCFSPYSIGEGLAMIGSGCNGDTANQIQRTLTYSLSFLPLYQYLNKSLTTSSGQPSQVYCANALWIDDQVAVIPVFHKLFQRDFGEPLQTLPIIQNYIASINKINRWTSEKTNGKIAAILENNVMPKETSSILTTAFYTKASWQKPFDRETQYLPFYANATRMIKTEMAHSIATYSIMEEGKWRLINLPFAKNSESLELILSIFYPKEAVSTPALESEFTWDNWIQWQKNVTDKAINLTFPRFRAENNIDLKEVFRKFGLTKIFNPEADFSSLTADKNFFINMALHKSFIRIDEKGADTTGVSYTQQEKKVVEEVEDISVNRPFIFVLWDRKTDAILLLGRIIEP